MTTQVNSLNSKYIKVNGKDNNEISAIKIIMIREIIEIDIHQIAEIEGHHRVRGQYGQSYRGRQHYVNNY